MKHRGYEVKCNGEAFMIAFADTLQALNFCLRMQTGILPFPKTKEKTNKRKALGHEEVQRGAPMIAFADSLQVLSFCLA
jgi:hypothetical protein